MYRILSTITNAYFLQSSSTASSNSKSSSSSTATSSSTAAANGPTATYEKPEIVPASSYASAGTNEVGTQVSGEQMVGTAGNFS